MTVATKSVNGSTKGLEPRFSEQVLARAKKVAATKNGEPKPEVLTITPLKMETAVFKIRGTAPLVMNRFSQKSRQQMKDKQEAGGQATKRTARKPKDFKDCYEQAKHIAREGWIGIPAMAVKCALVAACRLVDFKMTLAKSMVFVKQDGFDRDDGVPLLKITKGKPHYVEHTVRNESGVADIRPRPMWDEWEAIVRIEYIANKWTAQDVANLLAAAGMCVGLLEGRPGSEKSCGMGWGTFELVN